MLRSHRRLFGLLLVIPLVILFSGLGYMVLMPWLEGKPRGFWHSLGWAAETLSTTGYGSDATWGHPLMVLYVIVWQFVGVFLVFLVVPVYLIPFLEERFEVRLPRDAGDLKDHVLVFRLGPAVGTLINELEKGGRSYLVIESDESQARRAVQLGHPVVFGSLEDGVLQRAGLDRARALVANGSDDENANAVLAARGEGFSGEILCLVEEPAHARPLRLAGATHVLTPRHILGSALAARASDRIDPSQVGRVHVFDGLLQVREVPLAEGSELAGKSLSEARVGERTGANVLGQWEGGELDAELTPSTVLEAGRIAIVAGSGEALDLFQSLAGNPEPARGRVLVAGAGEVGRKVAGILRRAGEEVVVIDRVAGDGVDLVGDALDEEVLVGAGVSDARAVVLALDRDSATLFATVILRDIAPGVPVIARVNRAINVGRTHQAGAQFALSISQVSGRMLAFHLLSEDAFELHPKLKVLKVSARDLAGNHPSDLGLRRRTGCSIVAVDRGGDLRVHLNPDFTFARDDRVYVCGSQASIRRYRELFPPGQ